MKERFLNYLNHTPHDDYVRTHITRYVHSLEMIAGCIQPGYRVLELGGRSILADFIETVYDVYVANTESDLRYEFNLPDSTFEMVLNMEVIEHLKDRESDNHDYWGRTMFTSSGIKSCLSECNRVLVPGGCMFLSTPNACSALAVYQIIAGNGGSNYRPHVRELTLNETTEELRNAGFDVCKQSIVYSWSENLLPQHILNVLKLTHPGDNIMMLCKKI